MDYIAGGSELEIDELNENYYRRMNYPDNYKVQTMFISKFERDFNSQIDYQFVNAFPKLVTAIPVSYGAADLLKVTVSFTYDRYIVNPKGSIKKANTSEFNDIARVANESVPSAPVKPVTAVESTADTSATREQQLSRKVANAAVKESRKAPVAKVPQEEIESSGTTAVTGQNALETLLRRYGGDTAKAYAEYDKIRYGNTVPKNSFTISR